MHSSEQVERHLTANMNISKKDIIIGNFLGGLAWGFGTVVGAGVIVTAIGFILNSLGVFAAIGGFFNQVGSTTEQFQNLPQVPQLYR